MQQRNRKSSFKVTVTKFAIAKEILGLVAFGLVLATVDVYSDVALSYQFYTVNTTDYQRGNATAPSSGEIVSSYCMKAWVCLRFKISGLVFNSNYQFVNKAEKIGHIFRK